MEDGRCETSEGVERADKCDETNLESVAEAKTNPRGGGVQTEAPPKPEEAAKIRKKHRRGSKKHKPRKPRYKWRPYNKLSWEEKRKLNERDTIRAERRREEIRQKGRPIAPYNTTQFLMDEHDTIEPDLRDLSPDFYNHSPALISKADVEEIESVTSDESFYEKDFTEMYEATHAEALHSMSKEDLIKGYLQLENRIEFLEKQILSHRGSGSLSSESSVNSTVERKETICPNGNGSFSDDEKVNEDNRRLREENKLLREEIETLKDSLKS